MPNRIGHTIDPCGTPDAISSILLSILLTLTDCVNVAKHIFVKSMSS